MAVHGDTIVTGAFRDDDGGDSSGSVYVFAKPSAGWTDATQTAKLTAGDAAAGDGLGYGVGVHGGTVVASALFDDNGVSGTGSVYVFTEPPAGWADATQSAKLTASGSDRLGYSVAVDAGAIVAGAPFDDDGGESSGSVYVFTKLGSGKWVDANQSAKLTADDAADFGFLGSSVAVAGSTVVAGAAIGDDGQRGSVYVFDKQQGAWADATQTAKLTADDGVDGDELGFSVALGGGRVFAGAFRHVRVRGPPGCPVRGVGGARGSAGATR